MFKNNILNIVIKLIKMFFFLEYNILLEYNIKSKSKILSK